MACAIRKAQAASAQFLENFFFSLLVISLWHEDLVTLS